MSIAERKSERLYSYVERNIRMKLNNTNKWQCALELDIERNTIDGNPSILRKAIQNGADLRVHTAFQHNEHIDTSSSNDELILEAAEFRTTYCINNQWVAGIMTLRQPTSLPVAEFTQRPVSYTHLTLPTKRIV